jgi:RNA polymerase sigma-70 factor (family 1)
MAEYSIYTDQELVALLKQSDEIAYAEIFTRYNYVLLRHAVNKLRDREEARDIVQEVFTYLWQKKIAITFSSSLPGYLYGAVRNAILNRVAHKQVQERYLDSLKAFSQHGEVVTDHLIREKQLRDFIEYEISQLPAKMRQVFEMSRKENLSHKEIAEKLNIAEQTVSKQVTNALKILKSKLGIVAYLWLFMNH